MSTPRAKGTGTIFKPKGGRFYWIAYVSGGKRHFEGTKSERKKDAQDLLTSRLGDVGRGIAVTPKLGRKTLAAGLTAVVDDQKMNGRRTSSETRRQIDMHILHHAATEDEPEGGYFMPDRLMSTIATSDLTAYVAHRLAQGAAAASCNHELATMRRAFRLAVRGGELVHMPHVPMLTLHNVRTGFFERDEFDAVRAALPAEVRGIVTIAYFTGWRIQSEVVPLRWSQVDRNQRVIRLDVGTTKNREGRTLPYDLLPALVGVIDEQWREHERMKDADVICPFVFHRDGVPVRSFRGAWQAACVTAGCPGKLLHDFRRTAVRNLTRAGVPEQQAMKITGHKTRSVFDRYDIVNEADIRASLGKLAESSDAPPEAPRGRVQRFKS